MIINRESLKQTSEIIDSTTLVRYKDYAGPQSSISVPYTVEFEITRIGVKVVITSRFFATIGISYIS